MAGRRRFAPPSCSINGLHNLWNGTCALPPNGPWTDFISDFMTYTSGAFTPDIHRLWAGISTVSGALERRVWAPAGDRITYPNLYVLLVAPPGTGKYIIEDVKELWRSTAEPSGGDAFHVASDSVTRASLVDELNKAKSTRLPPFGPPYTYQSLLVAAEEFEVLLSSYDPPFISLINRIWNNPADHKESRRHGPAREVHITNPQLNILGGVQPAYFTAHFPEEAWSTGLIRRIIMVYADAAPIKDIFTETPGRDSIRQTLLHRLGLMSALYGPARWTTDAASIIRKWHLNGREPEPSHSKLQYYITSRTYFTIKLSLISAVSRTSALIIEESDVLRALQWLLEAESKMPDIFRAMTGKSDSQIIEELHYFVQGLWLQKKQKPVHTSAMMHFLQQRTTTDKIDKIIQIAERSNTIARIAGTSDLWVPRPRHLHGVE